DLLAEESRRRRRNPEGAEYQGRALSREDFRPGTDAGGNRRGGCGADQPGDGRETDQAATSVTPRHAPLSHIVQNRRFGPAFGRRRFRYNGTKAGIGRRAGLPCAVTSPFIPSFSR